MKKQNGAEMVRGHCKSIRNSFFICLRVSVREEKQQCFNKKGRAVNEVCVIMRFSPDMFSRND